MKKELVFAYGGEGETNNIYRITYEDSNVFFKSENVNIFDEEIPPKIWDSFEHFLETLMVRRNWHKHHFSNIHPDYIEYFKQKYKEQTGNEPEID